MSLQRAQKPYTFTDGRQVVVHEANWDIAAERDRIIEDARQRKSQKGSDQELLYFQEIYYSYLAPCSSGDVPDLGAAFCLPPDDLDGWYQAVIDTNPSWFLTVDRSFQEVVKFRGGLRLTVVSGMRPSSVMRRMHLELEAERVAGEGSLDIFLWYIYPRLAGCTRGAVPSADELRHEWPESEIYKWTDVARRGTPSWFSSPQQAAEQVQAEAAEAEKKKDKRRKRS